MEKAIYPHQAAAMELLEETFDLSDVDPHQTAQSIRLGVLKGYLFKRQGVDQKTNACCLIDVSHTNSWAAIPMALANRIAIASARQKLPEGPLDRVRIYCIHPGLEKPTLIYEMGSIAARYSEQNLISFVSSHLIKRIAKSLVSRLQGFDASIGQVVAILD